MPHPPECQSIVDLLANLRAQETAKLALIQTLTGVNKWKALQELGTLRTQIAEQEVFLADCDKQHAADLTTQINVIDLSGTSGDQRIARLWQLTADGQAVKQTATVQDGFATFLGVLGTARQSFGITIEGTDNATVNGPDFRSGPLPMVVTVSGDAEDPAKRIEIVILDPMVVSGDSLTHAAPPLPIQLSFPTGLVGTIDVAVNTLQFVINKGDVSLSASGTATGAGTTSTFTFSNSFHIVPSFSMAPSVLLEILSGVPPTLSIPGLIGTVVSTIAPLISERLVTLAVQPVAALLNQLIATQVASSLGLPSLPSGSVLAIRVLAADDATLTVTPVLGAFGTILSDFQPSTLSVVSHLAGLQIQPTSIGTSNPANRVAQGQITLDGPAPAGGVTVQLASDRPDVASITPAAVSIDEGAMTGVFTVTGITQLLMSTTNVDVTVTASLAGQTLTAPLSVRPESPATDATASAATPYSVAVTGVPSVVSLDLFTVPPLPRAQPIRGRVKTEGLTVSIFPVRVTLTPPSATPFCDILVQPEFNEGYFQFVVDSSSPATSIRMTVSTDFEINRSNPIDIPVIPIA
jgi:hypothetical protein